MSKHSYRIANKVVKKQEKIKYQEPYTHSRTCKSQLSRPSLWEENAFSPSYKPSVYL